VDRSSQQRPWSLHLAIICAIGAIRGWTFPFSRAVVLVRPSALGEETPAGLQDAIPRKPRGRVVIDTSAEEIIKIFADNTVNQAKVLFAPYRKRWIWISGTVFDVTGNTVAVQREGTTKLIHCAFRRSWEKHVLVLRKGEAVTILGRIEGASSLWLRLARCELR
jgi:hypothetical protein